MRPFSLLIKPVSADCNLGCDYCFYLCKSGLYPETARHRMTDEVLEQLIKSYMATDQPVYSFCWQGGEPTLAGIGFFARVVELQKNHGRPGARVSNAVQTNATRITDDMAALFSRYRFLVGCSLDGPADLHDTYRRTVAGKKTQKKVLKGIETLVKHGVDVNILTLVSRANVDRPGAVYRFLKSRGFGFQQYIPCVPDAGGRQTPFSISGKAWGRFLKGIFDAWYPDDVHTVSIRNFDAVLSKLVDGMDTICTMGTNCRQYLVAEYNGDIYPCDFFVEPGLKIGNIMDTGWQDLRSADAYLKFGRQKSDMNPACRTCDFLTLCSGDCPRNRIAGGDGPSGLSCLCDGNRSFYAHTLDRFRELGNRIRHRRGMQ